MDKEQILLTIKEMADLANKEVGQNYLIDLDKAREIVNFLDVNKKDKVLEIGSGFGPLSIFLLEKEFKSLTLNDIDLRAIEFLKELTKDIKKVNVNSKSAAKLNNEKYTKVIGNLPYYITTDLLEKYFSKCKADKFVFMVQKEVIDRIIAKVNSPQYAPLSILASTLGIVKIETYVSKTSFLPSPHIDSVVFSLTRTYKDNENLYMFLQFLKKMFIHRRKTIYSNLSLFLKNKERSKEILDLLSVKINLRPENIDPITFMKMFKEVNKCI